MKISVVIATYNEGPDLRASVALAVRSRPKPWEIIVCDDHSDSDVAAELKSFPEVTLIRTPERVGAGRCKGIGIEHAKGDVVIVLDAHMTFPSWWLNPIEEACSLFPDSIFCSACQGFNYVPGRFVGAGAKFERNCIFPEPAWMGRTKKNAMEMVPCVYGGAYILPRQVLNEVPWNPCYYGWGCEEQDISLRTWMAGFQVRCLNDLIISHNFDRIDSNVPGARMNAWQVCYNIQMMCMTLFEDGVYERLYKPFLQKTHMRGKTAQTLLDKEKEISSWRKRVQASRIYSDAELNSLCQFRLPTEEFQMKMLHRTQRKVRTNGKPS